MLPSEQTLSVMHSEDRNIEANFSVYMGTPMEYWGVNYQDRYTLIQDATHDTRCFVSFMIMFDSLICCKFHSTAEVTMGDVF